MLRKIKHRLAEETGTVLLVSLIALMFGALVMVPFLDLMATGLNAGIKSGERTDEIYAADAGFEDALQKISKLISELDGLGVEEEYSYTIDSVNDNSVNVVIQRITLLEGLMGDDEYSGGQPHEGWIDFDLPPEAINPNPGEGWVEYTIYLYFYYDGTGNRQLESTGAFFAAYPGDIIEGPYDEVVDGVITFDDLESQELKVAAGGYSFIYRWVDHQGPTFTQSDREGSITFKYKVYDPDYTVDSSFVWATFKEQDISYVTTAEMGKWIVTATVGNTVIKAQVLRDNGVVSVLSYELNPVESTP